MFLRITLFLITCTLFSSGLIAQETWSLEKCVRYAQQNSLTIKQAQYGIQNAELNAKQQRFNRLPSVNGSMSAGVQFGRTIDPTTNSFNNDRIGFNSYSLNAGVTVFNGNRINNAIKQSKIDLEAAVLDAEASVNDISLLVASAYLNILLAEEQLENAKNRLELSQEQLDQTEKMIQAGTLPVNDRLDFVAQIALDEQTIIEAENQVNINYLNLKQLMVLDPSQDIRIVKPDIAVPSDANPEAFTLEQVYSSALGTQPQVKAGDLRIESAKYQELLAKGNLLPRVSIFDGLSTNYSSIAKDFLNPNTDNAMLVLEETGRPVVVNGQEAIVQEFFTSGVVFPNKSYTDQLNENFGQNVGISVQVPIYNNHFNRISMERARVNALNAEVSSRQIRQTLKTNVQRAIADAKAAKESFKAAQRSVDAAEAAYDNSQKRFDLGAINTLEFSTARNNFDRAQVELTRAKFQYIFNLKIVDFYLGKELKLD